MTGATITGGSLQQPSHATVVLPENLDDMFEATPPASLSADALPFAVTLHYDFREDGYGLRDWSGRYDGHDLLYFPVSMVVGNGVWAAGWYYAVRELAEALRGAITSPPTTTLPVTGGGQSRGPLWHRLTIALLAGGIVAVGLAAPACRGAARRE